MSNSQTWAETFAPIQSAHRDNVFRQTWGHLAPEKNTSYKGHIVFIIGGYNAVNGEVAYSQFEGLEDSPWLYQAMLDLVSSFDLEDGVYRIACTLRNYRFYGTPKLLIPF